ncbi:hypothetical protein, partial [Sinorhizobium meliloti]|uniref:hypothetical protein n=1 Tax=Rhizobium meliloti TaxID=382 RepID=UPI0013E32604
YLHLAAVVAIVAIPEMVAVAADGPYGHAVTSVGVLVTIEAVVLAAVLASVHDPDTLVLLIAAA